MYANMSESTFLNLKDFTPNALRRPNKDLVATLLKAEDIFLAAGPSLPRTDNILLLLMNRSSHLAMPTCHLHPSMCHFFLKKYFLIRVHHSCKLLTYSLKDDQRTRQKKYKRLNGLAKTCLGRACRHSIRKCIELIIGFIFRTSVSHKERRFFSRLFVRLFGFTDFHKKCFLFGYTAVRLLKSNCTCFYCPSNYLCRKNVVRQL
jgi:hypothetical protein